MDSSPLFLLSILFLSFPLSFSQKPNALVVPVTKDPSTLQYIVNVNQRTPLVPVNLSVDLSGQYLWVDCDSGYVSSTYRPARCRSAACSAANAFPGCSNHCFSKPRPGCNNNTCDSAPENSFTGVTASGEVATDVFSVPSTDGSKFGPPVVDPKFIFLCAHTSLLEGLARGTTGVIGLGRNKVAAPQQLAATFGFQRTFAICLSSASGVLFFGSGPYLFRGIDVSISLSDTPLLLNPVSIHTPLRIPEYFIGVKSIEIDNRPIKLNETLLQINKNGTGGTKISTVHPYTVLERSIYKAVLSAFGAALRKNQSQAKRVAPIAPFGLCYDANSIPEIPRLAGPNVPTIDLVLHNTSVSWSIIGANSMVAVGNALCLGFVDGGINPTTSIVIGGHQLEDNLLMFDLAKSRLGFSNALVWSKIFCSSFDFTT